MALREQGRFAEAAVCFTSALRQNPASAQRWCDLGETLLEKGDSELAEFCFRRALELGPNRPAILFRAGNFFYATGREHATLENMAAVLTLVRDYDSLIFRYYTRLILPPSEVWRRGIPPRPVVAQAYFRHLVDTERADLLPTAWQELTSRGCADRHLLADYTDFLLARREIRAAAEAFDTYVGRRVAAGNQVFNAGFENEPVGAAFDWRMVPHEHVLVDCDEEIPYAGSRALRLRFLRKTNLAYHHTAQVVVARPGPWRFQAWVRSDQLTAGRGLGFRIYDGENVARLNHWTDAVRGTSPWRRIEERFTASPETRLFVIEVVCRPLQNGGERPAGTAWIDEVSLVPESC
jgi:hypothetical protein